MSNEEQELIEKVALRVQEKILSRMTIHLMYNILGIVGAVCTGLVIAVMAWDNIQAQLVQKGQDRFTGTMAYIAEQHRSSINSTYKPVDIRRIQHDNYPGLTLKGSLP